MTDKSFGDFYNKNPIKNPLLSSAVTGLSLDELTHKAVLLPVSPVQELNARSEQQGTQNATLSHTHHEQPNPAGDAFSNIQISSQTIPGTNKNITTSQKSVKTENTQKTSSASQSKASVKSEDDFDVNEYIARLQGTRYVSAPLHSHLKDDNNANLSATEENLEEINLNETQNVEVQQSLTADLAQNFSQLPTVLPHVASAVFSSFSNMLNLRSRDQTPDDKVHQELKPHYQDQGYLDKPGQGFQERPGQGLQQGNTGVPLTVEDRAPKEFGPPPREPPVMTGPSNFRLPPKKKYAQIPGLSTGETQSLPYSAQAQASSIPSFFTPGQIAVGGNETANTSTQNVNIFASNPEVQASAIPSFFTPGSVAVGQSETTNTNPQNVTNLNVFSPNEQHKPDAKASTVATFFTPSEVSVGVSEIVNINSQNVTNVTMFPVNEQYKPEVQAIPSFITPIAVSEGPREIENSNTQNAKHANESSKPEIQAANFPVFFSPNAVNIGARETANANTQSATTTNLFSAVTNEPYKTEASQQAPSRNDPNLFAINKELETNPVAQQFVSQTPIIPPPPMFSNLRKDIGQSTQAVGKTILPPSVARRIFTYQTLNRSQNVPPSTSENIFVPDPATAPIQIENSSQSQPTVFQNQDYMAQSSAVQDQALPQKYTSSATLPTLSRVPPTGPTFCNLSNTGSKDFIAPSIQGSQSQQQIAPSPQSSMIEKLTPPYFQPGLTQPPQPVKQTNQSTQSSTSGSQISKPYSTVPSESQSVGVPMFFTPSEVISASNESVAFSVICPQMPLSETSSIPASSQSSTLFTPDMKSNLAQLPTVPTQPSGSLYLSQNEPPKPLIEPPKATGPVSFRMTKKRPQYYSGPIEGVGSISNQVKATIPAAVPSTDLQATLFTPESVTSEGQSHSEAFSVAQIATSSDRPKPLYNAPFDLNQPIQEYNTAFDLSRPSTDAYDQTKPEPKGFGLIGSLKSKLSSLDINKIQSTVTTFFDPAYNDTKNDESSSQENVPDEQNLTIHVSNEQTPSRLVSYEQNPNRHIPIEQNSNRHVPNEQNPNRHIPNEQNPNRHIPNEQNPNRHDPNEQNPNRLSIYRYDPSTNDDQYFQMNLTQNYEEMLGTNYVHNTNYYPEKTTDNSSHQEERIDYDKTYCAPDIPPDYFYNVIKNQPNIVPIDEQLADYIYGIFEDEMRKNAQANDVNTNPIFMMRLDHTSENNLLPQPDVITTVDQYSGDVSANKTENNNSQIIQAQNYYSQASTNLFGTSQQDTSDTSFHGDNSNQFGHVGSVKPHKPAGHFNYPQTNIGFETRDVNPDIIEDTLRQFPNTAQGQSFIINPSNAAGFFDSNVDNNIKIDEVPTLAVLGATLADDETEPTQDIPNYLNQQNEDLNVQTARLADNLTNLTVSEVTREAAVEIRSNGDRRQSAEALAAASTAPLFGLSAIIADRSREVEEVRPFNSARRHSIIGAHSSATFLENIPTNDSAIEKPDLKGLSITDVRNVLLIEPPQEDICAVLKRNASSNIDSSTPEVRKDNYLLDTPGSSFFDHTLRDEVEQDDSELNICETCREVNTPDAKVEDVTAQLIDNITSRIQLSNVVEFPYIKNIPPNLPLRETAIDDQLEDIRNITEDTIETLHAQASIEILEESSNPEYAAYSTAIQSCKYAFEDPEPIVKSNLNFKLDPDTEASLGNYSAYYDSSTYFYHNRLPENASDETKANYQASSQEDSDDENSEDKSEEAGLDVHLIEQDANQDFPIDEEYIIEPSETDDDKVEIRERLRTPETSDTFTHRLERFQKAVDAGECFSYNSPTSLASYFDTGNYAVEAHYRNSQTSPDLANLRFPPGFEDEYDRRMSGYNGSPLAPQIPDCGTQTRSINTATYSNARQRNRKYSDDRNLQLYTTKLPAESDITETVTCDTSDAVFRDPETEQLFKPTAPELSVIEAKTPDLSTINDKSPATETNELSEPAQVADDNELTKSTVEGCKLQEDNTSKASEKSADIPTNVIEQKTLDISAKAELRPEKNVAKPYSISSQLTSDTMTQESKTPASNLFEIQNPALNLFDTQAANEITIREKEIPKESFPESQTTKMESKEQNSAERNKNLQTEEPRRATELLAPKLTNIFDTKPAESVEEPKTTKNFFGEKPINVFEDSRTSNNEQQLQNTNITEHKLTQNINVTAQALPDPINFFSSKDESQSSDTTEFNRLASYFSTPTPKPDHSKSFFELSQSQNHYRHSSANNAQNEPQLDQNATQNLTNLMRDLTSPQHIPNQENIVRTVNYFTVEYDIKNNVKELVNNTETGESNVVTNKGDNSNIKTEKKQLNIDEKTEINNQNFTELPSDEILIKTIINCYHCNLTSKQFKVRKCANDTEPTRESVSPDMEQTVTKKPIPNETDTMLKHEDTEDGVTVVVETRSSEYTPVRHHWFYRYDVEDKSVWRGFSVLDSTALEEAFLSPDLNENTVVATDGGRFDVNIVGRLRVAVYWKEKPTNVRRCSWFYKGTTDARYVPYTEGVAEKLEDEYRHGITTGEWHRRLVLPNNEVVIMHGPTVMVHFWQGTTDAFSTPAITLLGKRVYRNPPKIRVAKDQPQVIDHLVFFVHGAGEYKRNSDDATSRPRVVRRGHEESEIEEASPTGMDHLLLLCHGVGSACDMRFRSVEEVVEDFRATSLQLVQAHYKNSFDNGIVNRVEVLPISWHAQLHGGEAGVDRRLQRITLDSIPRLRAFTNHTVLDVLFYTSPVYHQTIIDTVCFELNRIYNLFKQRNPSFKGGISLGGHSLGSVILYDLLCNQSPNNPIVNSKSSAEKTYLPDITSTEPIKYPVLQFHPDALYALGSPIAIFECIRGVETLGLDFCLPTCKNFFNIFHPYDPIAYRIEPLINPQLQDTKPFLIPHHKGRKRMHLELKDTMVRVGADLKQKLLESLRTTWNKWKATPPTDGQLEKVVEEEMEKEQLCEDSKEENQENIEMSKPDLLGRLNAGRRVDFVLQEAPLEMINEYLFAMSSHVGYWESEDTMLLMLREIYSSLGVQPDSTVPQQSMTVQRTRTAKLDEAMVVNEKDYPSTSRGGVS